MVKFNKDYSQDLQKQIILLSEFIKKLNDASLLPLYEIIQRVNVLINKFALTEDFYVEEVEEVEEKSSEEEELNVESRSDFGDDSEEQMLQEQNNIFDFDEEYESEGNS